tara:strand:- start:354 stop:1031 length:678 start_codon:yes stop_codon:yes gene_type:complete
MLFNRIYNNLHIIQNIYFKHKNFLNKKTYSLFGEDLAALKFFKNKKKGFYVDIGCYHPTHINNTYLLYKKGWNGINIDVSQFSIDLFKFMRPDDLNYKCAVSETKKKVNLYYQKEHSQLTSINKLTAKKFIKGRLKKKIINSYSLEEILSWGKYKDYEIDFLDVDVEGADLQVLKGLNFSKRKPKLICVEIHQKNFRKHKIYRFLIKKKYKLIWQESFSFLFKRN